jgi:hypothetical protein
MTVSIRRPFQPLADGDPSQVGRYQLLARLGAGGFGTVYLGQNDAGELSHPRGIMGVNHPEDLRGLAL